MVGVHPAGGPAITSILVPTDFSKHSERALAYAIPFARQFGAKLTLLHVIEPIATPDFEASFPLRIENATAKRSCEGVLTKTAEKLGIEPELLDSKLVRFGRPYNEIANAARTLKADLIIIATHGYTGFKHAFLGSTAERVVRHAPCPVLVVRAQVRGPAA
jgi:universal stress protein A